MKGILYKIAIAIVVSFLFTLDTAAQPKASIILSETTLDFENVYPGYTSRIQRYTVEGVSLSDNITISAPTGYEIATNCTGSYGSSLTLTESGGSVSETTIYVRFAPNSYSTFIGNISHTSGAVTENIAVNEANAPTNKPSGYYSTATGSGQTLKNNLHNIIQGHTVVSYDDLWTAFEDTDAKPNGKVWGMYSDKGDCEDPPYEFIFYVQQDSGFNGTAEGQVYNREHSFPKSWWGGSTSNNQYSDMFHLIPADKYLNIQRSNNEYGEISSPTKTYLNGSKKGPNSYTGSTGETAFEPINKYKGDLARGYFYLATRYKNEITGWASSCPMIDGDINDADGSVFEEWALNMLLDWHAIDPVSMKEKNRNDAIYLKQNNRNPYIDNPGYVNLVWGGSTAPVIFNITATPSSPTSSQSVSVSADISDNGTITTAYLVWGTSSGSLTNGPVSMSTSKSGTYVTTADIPTQSNGTTVYYKITAEDNNANTSISEEKNYSVKDVLWVEDFSNPTYTVTLGTEGSGATGDYFMTTDGSDINKSYSGVTGNFFAGQDIDGITGGVVPSQISWTGIDISGQSDLTFSGDFGEQYDSPGDIDASDYLLIEYQIDGGGWNNLLAFENDGSTYNSNFFEDTNFDGDGDGNSITTADGTMFSFSKAITGTGSSLDLRFTASVNSGDEDFAIDNFYISTESGSTPPQIYNITQTPASSITNSEAVSVSADVTDDIGVSIVEMHWGTTSGSLANTINMGFESGNTYTTNTTIPSQSIGTTIYYKIFAEDAENASATSSEQSYTVIENIGLSLPYFQGFETALGDMATENVSGTQAWESASFGQPAPCAMMSGYESGTDYANEDWLITPTMDFSGSYSNLYLFFDEAIHYEGDQGGLIENKEEAWISTDYTGTGDPETNGNWTELDITNRASGNSWDFVSVDAVDLSAYIGNSTVYIAFKYTSYDGEAGTWEIDNIRVTPELIINEFLADPATDHTGDANGDGVRDASDDEFIELFNNTDSSLNISGWEVYDGYGLRHTFPVNTVIPAESYIVLFGGGTPTGDFGGSIIQTASTGQIGLNNSGDDIIIKDASSNTIAAYTFGSEGGNDQSLTRDADIYGNFSSHATANGSGGELFSPGTFIDDSSSYTMATGTGNWADVIGSTSNISNVRIPKDIVVEVPAVKVTNECKNLIIEAGGALTVNGQLDVNKSIYIQSDSTATGSIINNGILNIGDQTYIEQFLNTTTIPNWHYMSMPVNSETADAFPSHNSTYAYFWTEGWEDWTPGEITNPSTALNVMTGYAVPSNGNVKALFEGTLNDTEQSLPGLTTTNGTSYEGYYLVGNPYPSPIDLSQLSYTNITEDVWFRADGNFATYNINTGATTNGATQYAPANQALWIKVIPGSTGSITFPLGMRTHTTHEFYKKAEPNLFRMVAEKGKYSDEIAIGFYDGATNDFENFDTEKRFAEALEYPQLYSISNGVKLSVNSLCNKNEFYTIPLGIKVNFAGCYTLSATNLNEFNNKLNVYLLDDEAGKTIELRKQNAYQVEFSTPGEYSSRLSLVFSNDAMYLNEQDNNDIKVFSNNNHIFIESQITSNMHFSLFDIKGNQIFSNEIFIEKGIQKVKLDKNLSAGFYFVNMLSERYTINEKIWLTK